MSVERHYSLRAAAKLVGVQRQTLKKWLAEDLAIVLPPVSRGSKVLIAERHIQAVVRKRAASSDWTLLRSKTA